jgi:hypothetical protein
LEPLFFNVVNKQIVSIISDGSVSQRLRSRAIQFLTHIARKDTRIHQLILQEIDFATLLHTNMFAINQEAMIPIAAEFLKCFQTCASFLKDLYAILIQQVRAMPNGMASFAGYEALVGMLKWALPLDTESTLMVLVDTLC